MLHRILLLQFAGACRWVFNRGLDQRQKAFAATGKSPSYFEQNMELTTLKKMPEFSWLKDVHSQVLQQALKDLERAFRNFFERVKKGGKPGYPKFRKKGQRERFRFPQGVKIEGSKVFLPIIGWVKFHKSREIQGTINEATIVQEGDDWFVSFSCSIEKTAPQAAPIDEDRAVGIDVGLSHFATTAAKKENTCKEIENPRYLKTLLPHLRFLFKATLQKSQEKQKQTQSDIQAFKTPCTHQKS